MVQLEGIRENQRLSALRELAFRSDTIHMAYAWAHSGNGQADHWQAIPLDKVSRAVIGAHFVQTEPYALRQLPAHDRLRVVDNADGVFHPKFLIGLSGTDATVIVGFLAA